MKTLINKIFAVAVLSVALVACSKEEVKPFCGTGADSAINATKIQDSDNGGSNSTTTNSDGNSVGVVKNNDETTVTGSTENGDPDGTGITDGGTSSDYDSKGSKRKPLR